MTLWPTGAGRDAKGDAGVVGCCEYVDDDAIVVCVESGSPRLLDRVREAIRTRHYSPRTERTYVGWIRRFILFHGKRHPRDMGEAEVVAFLSSLAIAGRVSGSTQNQALSALVFLYSEVLGMRLDWLNGVVRARRPARIPVVLSRDEVRALLGHVQGTAWLMASLMYGSGLRLLECVELRVKDLDLDQREIRVRDGKGRKDRVTTLPSALADPLKGHLARVRALHERDLADRCGWVAVPDALGRKYPNAGREWGWQWVFPATRHYVDRETGRGVGIICTRVCRSVWCGWLRPVPGWQSRRPVTRFGTRLRRICSRPGMTSGRSRNCWGIAMSARR